MGDELPLVPPRLFVLRHGHSVANERGLIASTVESAGEAFGLTELGREQISHALTRAHESGQLEPPVTIISSPLLRARESADIAATMLNESVKVDDRLVERGFGDFELESEERYEAVWQVDVRDPTHGTWGVESVVDVLARVRALVEEVMEDVGDKSVNGSPGGTVLLVTHGDVASTLICASMGSTLDRHREVGALHTGDLRELDWPPSGASPIFGGPGSTD
jgi:broad specificity phosphatase PhoE